ncbi:uncharacterized protein LOC131163363 [Malania oleifera]|uniref:uncharacterized protein LOC131163363 n=1 Tax=Malania oleifera TaxID=397392 RepID=UPI0025AE9020|nr:uncharacterized protein LOC131163363 [Malania oleifera]
MRPPSFSRGPNPIVAENWVQDVEEILVVLVCTNEQKVVFATCKLIGEAKHWWRSARMIEEQRPNPVPVSWSRFKELFFEQYFPAIIQNTKAAEFLHLTQGLMTVTQYAARFLELYRFAPHLAPDEEKNAKKAAVIESGMQRSATAQGQRKRSAPQDLQASSSRGPWRGDRFGGGQGRMMGHGGFQGGQAAPTYPRCGRRHPGECGMGENVCYGCGRPRHRSWSCQGLTAQAPAPRPYRGVTHSFVSAVYAKLTGYEAQFLDIGLAVAMPTGLVVRCKRVLRGFPVTI